MGWIRLYSYNYDRVFFCRDAETAHYFHEVTISSLVDFESVTGYPLQRCIVMVMEYGGGYSGPGKDVFNPGRATAFANRAHKSNFLHPVLYYYDSPPNGRSRCAKLVFFVVILIFVASELKDPICHSDECQIGSFSSEATYCWWWHC